MAEKAWHPLKVQFCEHADCEVALQVQVVYPADIMPDQPPRVIAHRCSDALTCNLSDKPSCVWAGTNPGYDPFT
jgi:hypothetical protein